MSSLHLPRHLRRGSRLIQPGGFAGYGTGIGGLPVGNRWPLDPRPLSRFFAPGQLLAQWPLYGPQLVTDDSAFGSPDTFNANPPWVPVRLTMTDAHTMRETAVLGTHPLYQIPSFAVGPCAVSFDFEADGRDWARIRFETNIQEAWFDVSNGVVGTVNGAGASAGIAAVAGFPGRWRCTLTGDFISGGSVWTYPATGDGVQTYLGDVTKGLKIYNAVAYQTSIVTAPNLYGDAMLALYGDRFDLMNATKTSQPVLLSDAWNGLEAAVFSGANYLTVHAIAALFSGANVPMFNLTTLQRSGSVNGRHFALGNSGSAVPFWELHELTVTSGWRCDKRSDASVLVQTDGGPLDLLRHCQAYRNDGADDYFYTDATLMTGPLANAPGATTLDNAAIGANIRNGVLSNYLTGTVREAAAGTTATDAQMLAASNYLAGRSPP